MKKRLTHDYRIFVGAFPTGDLADRIQALRQRHDPQTASITAPHVTLAGTYWRTDPATPENESDTIARLQAVRDQLHSFELQLGGVRSFLPATPVLYLHVTPTAELLTVRRTLLAALGQDKHHHFVPHLTLTMRLGKDETESLLARLQETEWHTGRWSLPLDQLWLMQRGPADPAWRYIHRLDLTPSPHR
jgi:2'-5' RNA ligase